MTWVVWHLGQVHDVGAVQSNVFGWSGVVTATGLLLAIRREPPPTTTVLAFHPVAGEVGPTLLTQGPSAAGFLGRMPRDSGDPSTFAGDHRKTPPGSHSRFLPRHSRTTNGLTVLLVEPSS